MLASKLPLLCLLAAALAVNACRTAPPVANNPASPGVPKTALKLTGAAFADGAAIPPKYTCDGANLSPPLQINAVPSGAKSLALVCDDPDAPGGTWVHWVLYNVPSDLKDLPEGLPAAGTLANASRQGLNSFTKIGYGGPCPPPGPPHHYVFKLYALDAMLSLPDNATRAQFDAALAGHILGEGHLTGIYARK